MCKTDSLEKRRHLGDTVEADELIARVHDLGRTGEAPIEYRARRGGILAARHFPGLIGCGDTLAVVAEVVTEAAT